VLLNDLDDGEIDLAGRLLNGAEVPEPDNAPRGLLRTRIAACPSRLMTSARACMVSVDQRGTPGEPGWLTTST